MLDKKNIQINLRGFGVYNLEKENYVNFAKTLDIDLDLFLDNFVKNMLYMSSIGAVPEISINLEKIEKEGKHPYDFIKTEIGEKRFNELTENGIIKKI